MREFVVMGFFNKDSGKLVIINDGYISSQLYKYLWIRGFSDLLMKYLLRNLFVGLALGS